MNKISQYAGGLASVVIVNSSAFAADLDQRSINPCAVSATNGKAEAGGGYYKDQNQIKGGVFHGAGSVAFALGCSFGFQLDTAIGALDGKTSGGVAGHAFTREPNSYLLGTYGEYSLVGKNDIWRVGAEGEVYLNRVTFTGLVGYENSDRTKGDIFASIGATFYATDNFNLSGGYRRFLDVDAGFIGAEWMLEDSPISVFSNGQIGSKKHLMLTSGVRYHFGGSNKSLLRRHREDDPINQLTNLIRRVPRPSTGAPAPIYVPPI